MLAAWTAADTENAQEEAAAQEQMHETAFSNAFAQQTHTTEHDFDETQAELARLLSEANPDFYFAAPVEADDDYSNLFNAATEFGQYEEYAAAAVTPSSNKSIFTPQQKKRKAIVQEDVIIDEEPAKKRRLEERGLSALISKVKGEKDQEGRTIALPPVPEFWSYELEPMQDVREKQKVMKELAVVEGGDPCASFSRPDAVTYYSIGNIREKQALKQTSKRRAIESSI